MENTYEPEIKQPRATAVAVADLLIGATWPPQKPDPLPLFNPKGLPSGDPWRKLYDEFQKVCRKYPDLCFGATHFVGDDADSSKWQPYFFAKDENNQGSLGSGAKIMICYAAFQLREDVRGLIKKGVKPGDIRKALLDLWSASSNQELKAIAKETPRRGSAPPFIDYIFDFGGAGGADFDGHGNCGIPNFGDDTKPGVLRNHIKELGDVHKWEYDEIHNDERWREILARPFAERLWLTTRWSDNAAATTCATQIGLPYINALLRASGLYDAKRNRGMKLYRGYEDPPHGVAEFKSWFDQFGRWYRYSRTTDDTQAGNVATLSALLAALVRRKLFDPNVNDEMVSFLRVADAGAITSYVEWSLKSLLAQYSGYLDLWSKLGIFNSIKTDCAYLRYRSPKDGKEYRMGLVLLNYRGPGPDKDPNCEFNNCVRDIFLALNPDFRP